MNIDILSLDMYGVSNRLNAIGLISILISIVTANAAFSVEISGTITSADCSPIVGANVKLLRNDSLLIWKVSDASGEFYIDLQGDLSDKDHLEFNAIGYSARMLCLDKEYDLENLKIILTENPIDLGSIVVESPKLSEPRREFIAADIIEEEARRSIVPTNSTSAIRQPQAVREGSAQSAKIRVNGTSPDYYINGVTMGDDPNHYGIFNIIASPNLSGLNFYVQGAPARYESPSIIEFKTPQPFQKHFKDIFNFSLIEGTGFASFGTGRFFLMTSFRKSFLDLLVKEAPLESDRLTIPPTSFIDWFASSGVKLSPKLTLISDQYFSRDYLKYSLPGTKKNPSGMNIKQCTESQFVSLRLESLSQRLRYRVGFSTRAGIESYDVAPSKTLLNSAMRVNLWSNQRIYGGDAEIGYSRGSIIVTAGNSLNYISGRRLNLRQRNWNFMPPDASSDNPYFYQPELDSLYGSIKLNDIEIDNYSYLSITGNILKFKYSAGIRESYFQRLRTKWNADYRLSIGYDSPDIGALNLAYGTYSQSPVKRVLEPYQALVRVGLNRLDPVGTKLFSLDYSIGKIQVGAFAKRIERLPILTPDFSQVNIENRQLGNGFLTMESVGKLNSYGGDITLNLTKFPVAKSDMTISYGYTRSFEKIDGVTIPYELDAPHKVNIELSFKLNNTISFGGILMGHSGYPYSPPLKSYDNYGPNRYSESYYKAMLAEMYSARFPFNYQTSIYFNLNWEHSHLYLTILNLTNRKNPIISSADGFIYDNGILPSLGFSCQF